MTSSDIQAWVNVNNREAQGLLPHLIDRLVRASCDKYGNCYLPFGDAVSHKGFDGIVTGVVGSRSQFLPDGDSLIRSILINKMQYKATKLPHH